MLSQKLSVKVDKCAFHVNALFRCAIAVGGFVLFFQCSGTLPQKLMSRKSSDVVPTFRFDKT